LVVVLGWWWVRAEFLISRREARKQHEACRAEREVKFSHREEGLSIPNFG
jgi:hypothetical protein